MGLFKSPEQKAREAAENQRKAVEAEKRERIGKIKFYEKEYKKIGDRTQFPQTERQKGRSNYEVFGGSPLENKEYREYAEDLFQILLQKGAILCEGKMYINKQVVHGQDFDLLFTAGRIKEKKKPIGAPSRQLISQNVLTRLMKSSEFLGLEEGSDIATYIQSTKDGRKDIALPEFWDDMSEDTESVMYLVHQFASGHSSRGRIIIKMMYILPSEIGKIVEKDVEKNPWLLEALSELVAEKAGVELAEKKAKIFDFQPDYYAAQGVEMFAPSVSPAPKTFRSYYNP